MTDVADWIGRRWRQCDIITDRQVGLFRTALGDGLTEAEVPPGFHWTMILDTAAADQLGADGHPRLGLFMPDLGLPRRMWAGGSLRFHQSLCRGDMLNRESVISDITFKNGASGRLGFVTVEHLWSVDGDPRIEERQDVVYRSSAKPGIGRAPEPAETWPNARTWTFQPDPTLLFRYSAVTFNGHRIHYDETYARQVERYDGLVVHGPLQATWMLNLATDMSGRTPDTFRYRGVAPLTCGDDVAVEAHHGEHGLDLRVRRLRDGVVTTRGRAIP